MNTHTMHTAPESLRPDAARALLARIVDVRSRARSAAESAALLERELPAEARADDDLAHGVRLLMAHMRADLEAVVDYLAPDHESPECCAVARLECISEGLPDPGAEDAGGERLRS